MPYKITCYAHNGWFNFGTITEMVQTIGLQVVLPCVVHCKKNKKSKEKLDLTMIVMPCIECIEFLPWNFMEISMEANFLFI